MNKEQKLVKALEFYADPDTYYAIGFFPDPPCGDFIEDFDELRKPGARARKVLEEYYLDKLKYKIVSVKASKEFYETLSKYAKDSGIENISTALRTLVTKRLKEEGYS
jgi:hypothetical protein